MNRLPLATVAACAASLALVSGCVDESSAFSGGNQRPPAVVDLGPVTQGSFDTEMKFIGRLQAESAAELYARAEGPIVAIRAGTGDRVQKGQVLALIDPAEAEQRVEQARASLRMAEATLEQRRADLEVARATAGRTTRLFEQQLVSESDQDVAQAESITSASQVELSRAQISQARANLNGALLALEQTKIIAPFDGYIGKRYLDLGAYATTNRPVFSLVDLSTIRTTIAIPADAAGQIRVGQAATVVADPLPAQTFRGTVSRIASVFDPQTDTVEAEVEIANPDGVLKPGMFANVAVSYRTNPTALLVPAPAVVRNDREEWVFVAVEDTETSGLIARRVPVSASDPGVGRETLVAVEPLEGEISSGMKVVVLGQEALRDGDSIVIQGNTAADGETKR